MLELDRLPDLRQPPADRAPARVAPHPAAAGWEQRGYRLVRRGRDLLLAPLSAVLARAGVPPSLVTLLGVLFALSTCFTLPTWPVWALGGLLGAILSDALDGALARRLGAGSALGKLLDQLGDLATFTALMTALGLAGLVPVAAVAFGVVANALLLGLGVAYHRARHPGGAVPRPRAGFFAHAHKALVYSSLALYLVSGVDWTVPAVVLANGAAALCAVGFSIGLLRSRGSRRGAVRLEPFGGGREVFDVAAGRGDRPA